MRSTMELVFKYACMEPRRMGFAERPPPFEVPDLAESSFVSGAEGAMRRRGQPRAAQLIPSALYGGKSPDDSRVSPCLGPSMACRAFLTTVTSLSLVTAWTGSMVPLGDRVVFYTPRPLRSEIGKSRAIIAGPCLHAACDFPAHFHHVMN